VRVVESLTITHVFKVWQAFLLMSLVNVQPYCLNSFGDLQDIVKRFNERVLKKNDDRTKKYFAVPRKKIIEEKYDLNWSRYHEDVYEEIVYEKPELILQKLIENEVGEDYDERLLDQVRGGILKELLELRRMVK
jgi:type I restriction enzyme M protein